MTNTISPEYKNSVALYITHTNPVSVKAAISPWKGKQQQIELITDDLNQSCWAFRVLNSSILADIDTDNVQNFSQSMKKDNISVNQLYRIPICEVPQATKPEIETLLHRAASKGAVKIFKYLLQNGAKPRRTGPTDQTVLEKLATLNRPSLKTRVKLGKLLVAAGITPTEIQELKEQNCSNRSAVNFCNGLLTYIQNIKNYEGKSIIKRKRVPVKRYPRQRKSRA